jgi:hypothetical protein
MKIYRFTPLVLIASAACFGQVNRTIPAKGLNSSPVTKQELRRVIGTESLDALKSGAATKTGSSMQKTIASRHVMMALRTIWSE